MCLLVSSILGILLLYKANKYLADNVKRKVEDRLTEYVCNLGE